MADNGEGPYLWVTVGAGIARNACQSPNVTIALPAAGSTASCTEKSPVARAGFGYQYTPMWGLEVSYGSMGYAYSDGYANFPKYGVQSYSWQLKAVGAAIQGVATVHMGDSLAVFGKFGLASVDFTEDLSSWSTTVPLPYTGVSWSPVIHTTRNALALGAGVRYDVGLHGSIFALVESFGTHDIYSTFYGVPTKKVQLLTGSVGLMWRY